MASTEDYYDGFRTFSWLVDLVGLPIDQINFLLVQFTALLLGGFMRTRLNPSYTTANSRHFYGMIIGVAFGYFSFGRQAIHIIALPFLCYAAIRSQDPKNVQRIVFGIALSYLSCIHFHRQIYDYGSYTLDITGPLMVITQKVTCLACGLEDGFGKREDELTQIQRKHAVRSIPGVLEYFSYIFHFQTLMAGPVVFYNDYINFIHGNKPSDASALTSNKQAGAANPVVPEPSSTNAVVKKVVSSILCAAIFVKFYPMFPPQRLREKVFVTDTSILYRIWYLYMVTTLARFKYYHAWLFADAICNNSGIGFSGYKENGTPMWDLVSNVHVFDFETSLNLRYAIDAWNIGTNKWLRYVMYDRSGRYKILYTYALSAVWHGFYPGYYLTFFNGAFFTVAIRCVRRYVRPYFLRCKEVKFLYDALSLVATRLLLAYITSSFVILEFMPSMRIYMSLYLIPHILGLAAITLGPRIPRYAKNAEPVQAPATSTQEAVNGNAHKTE